MIKINGANETRPAVRTKKTSAAAPAFKPGETAGASGAGAAAPMQPTAVLGALIALQSEGGGGAKTFAAAQRTLDLLDELRLKILEGEADADALEALSDAAKARAHAAASPSLQAVYDEINLRARVELAKLGRA